MLRRHGELAVQTGVDPRRVIIADIGRPIEITTKSARLANPVPSGKVLVDGFDPEAEQYYGRTYADSPDIDGKVWLAADEDLQVGSFVQVRIDGTIEGDLSGYVVEEV